MEFLEQNSLSLLHIIMIVSENLNWVRNSKNLKNNKGYQWITTSTFS